MAISDADLEELSSMVMLLPRHACDKLRELVDLAARQLASVDELATLRAQRDEARELVRRYVEGDCLYDERNEEQACNAILRWDEEAKR